METGDGAPPTQLSELVSFDHKTQGRNGPAQIQFSGSVVWRIRHSLVLPSRGANPWCRGGGGRLSSVLGETKIKRDAET